MRTFALIVLALLAYASSARANLVTLTWTNPCFNAALVWSPDDSTWVPICDAGSDSLHDLAEVRVYGSWAGGGGPKLIVSRSELGKECEPDSIQVDAAWGYHFWITTRDFATHESCASNQIYICSPCLITGVPIPDPTKRSVTGEWYDVRGRKVTTLPSTGVFFHVWRINGVLQKPAQLVPVRDGKPLITLKAPR